MMENNNKEKDKLRDLSYMKKLTLMRSKKDYVANLINGRYFLARYNMMAEQIQTKTILENIDGCPKSMDYMRAEAAVMKKRAMAAFRDAHFGQLDLKKDFNFTDADIIALESDIYDGKIIRETYDESYKKGNKAEFVN